MATGGAARHRLDVAGVIASSAIEAALDALGLRPRAVVSLGGEDLVVYLLDGRGRVQTTIAGNKCASGTGEFFRQQLGRMDLRLEDLDEATEGARVLKLSARCSVFMKSDCTHRLNKGEATRGDVALSLSKVMADKVSEFLIRAKVRNGAVVLIGGVTQNRHFFRFLAEAWPQTQFAVPAEATYFEAFGAAHLAGALGRPLAPRDQLVRPFQPAAGTPFAPLPSAESRVTYHASRRGPLRPGAEYVLGVDGGSTTTKVALVDADTLEIAAAHYGRTHGDPVAALKRCLAEVQAQIGGARPRISLIATTGSSRELLGVFLETAGVYNEIIAHAAGTTFFEPDIDTLFEIGGQDAKYVLLNNGVPIDYAMNEACSAGTGSFLEESAAGDLHIERAEEIGPIALEADAPLKFGEHCSAFINSDIRKAIQGGASRPDIVAGLVFSIVANYLNRVVGNRPVGTRIALQGGVAKNPAVPLAFAQLVGKPVSVPPDPELMGCFGVARLALQKHREGLLGKGDVRPGIARRQGDRRPGRVHVPGVRQLLRDPQPRGRRPALSLRRALLQVHRRPSPQAGRREPGGRSRGLADRRTVRAERAAAGRLPAALRSHASACRSPCRCTRSGRSTRGSSTTSACGPCSRIACCPRASRGRRAATASRSRLPTARFRTCIDKGVDYLFLPHFRDMPSMEAGKVHACTCPLTQGLPYLARQAFGVDDNVLRPVVSFKRGWQACRPEFARVAEQLGFGSAEGGRAFDRAVDDYLAFLERYRQHGREVLAEMRDRPDQLYVGLFGRPYNAFTRDANMGIPRKFTSRGVTVVPFDLIYDEGAAIFPNMYWYYGQQDMKGLERVREVPNLYATWISNFSCAPDSFMLHYLRWMMGRKPYLVLEIDSHTADAGLDTRIEAFLDIVDSFRQGGAAARRLPVPARRYRVDSSSEPSGRRRHAERGAVQPAGPAGHVRVAVDGRSGRPRPGGRHAEAGRARRVPARADRPLDAVRAQRGVGQGVHPGAARARRRARVRGEPHPAPAGRGAARRRAVHARARAGPASTTSSTIGCSTNWASTTWRCSSPATSRRTASSAGVHARSVARHRALRLLHRRPDRDPSVRARRRRGPGRVRARLAGVVAAFERGATGDWRPRWGARGNMLAAIPRQRSLADVKKVLVVGEIYVRRDSFSVYELSEHLIGQGIFPKLSAVSEWLHYTDWARAAGAGRHAAAGRLARDAAAGPLAERLGLGLESWWKRRVEREIREALMPTGLIPEAHDDLDAAMTFGTRTFIPAAMQSEATVSPAVAGAAMQDGYSGVAIIAPFGCLPGRVIEGVYTPWARARGYPVLALENDGQPYPPNVICAPRGIRAERGAVRAEAGCDAGRSGLSGRGAAGSSPM